MANDETTSSATLIILGYDLDPDQVSQALNLVPSQAWRKGENSKYTRRDGTVGVFDSIHEWGGWKLWASEELRQMPLKAQLDHWLRVLVEHSAEIKQFKENGLEIILDCTLATRVYCLYLPAELQAQLAELGVDLEVTVYSRLRRMTRRQERNILRHR